MEECELLQQRFLRTKQNLKTHISCFSTSQYKNVKTLYKYLTYLEYLNILWQKILISINQKGHNTAATGTICLNIRNLILIQKGLFITQ